MENLCKLFCPFLSELSECFQPLRNQAKQQHILGMHIFVAGTSWWQAGLFTTHLNRRQFLSLSNNLDSIQLDF